MKEKVLQFINELINTYKYKPLPRDLSEIVRKKYEKYIPNYLKESQNKTLNINVIAITSINLIIII